MAEAAAVVVDAGAGVDTVGSSSTARGDRAQAAAISAAASADVNRCEITAHLPTP
jgi:hypothetical protein